MLGPARPATCAWNISACWPASRRCRCRIAATPNSQRILLLARSSSASWGLRASCSTCAPLVPNLPTIAEAGYPDFEYESYYVLAAPAGIPNSVSALLETEVQQSLADSGLQERFRAQDILIAWAGSVDTKARIEAEAQLWAKVVKAAGMRV